VITLGLLINCATVNVEQMEASPVYLGTDLSCQSRLQNCSQTLQIKLTQITVDSKNVSCFYCQENTEALKM
jgi:hypothetical protein